ncbi:MAG: type I DNA topoisomerase [Patescibacteria group bacterium]
MSPNNNKIKLLIVESPAKAKTISKYLDDEYTVRASIGHIRDLPKSSKNAIDIEKGFVPHYEVVKGKEKVIADIKSLAKKADEVLLATDPDREGEAIAWHIKEAVGLENPQRVVFNEITKEAVNEAIKHPRQIDQNLRQAQEARRVLDRLFGYDLSGLIWKKLRYGLSAGRVQSPALRILVEREKDIRAFVPEAYWVIDATFSPVRSRSSLDNRSEAASGGIPFVCQEVPKTAAEADKIVEQAKTAHWKVKEVEEKEVLRRARAPFTTSNLQQAASGRLGMSPANTMRLAQKLYEAGHITYMRTDSTNLSSLAVNDIKNLVVNKYGEKYSQPQQYATKSKNAQEAHEAIRPTHIEQVKVSVNPLEQKLYELIWSRAVSSQMAEAVTLRTKIAASAQSSGAPKETIGDIPDFVSTGSRILFDGWLKADPHSAGEEVILPELKFGDPLTLQDITSTGKATEPPNRYTEAGLVKELEKRGIGRPSTYAAIVKTIQDRGYVVKENRSLQPTATGEVVSDFLDKYFHKYISDEFTAIMEDELDEIANGNRKYVATLKEFYGPFKKEVDAKQDIPKISDLGAAPADIKCPVCDGPMIIKLGRSGKFYSCAKFPDCHGARTIDGQALEAPKATGEKCPECHEGKLVERDGRYGKFIACSRYPKCKYIKKDENGGQGGAGDTGVKCPECGVGTMVEKRGRYGVFYGCSNYPKCKNIIKSKPTGELCKLCGHLMMQGTKTIPERCSNKACPNNRPDKKVT